MKPVIYNLTLEIILASIIVIFDFLARNRMDKKKRFIIKCILAGIFGIVIIFSTMQLNPSVHATIQEDGIAFKSNEHVKFSNIESITYFKDTEIELVAIGFRWGNNKYYSGDANIRFLNTDGTEKEYVFKCKAYMNGRSNDYILIKQKNSTQDYVFNFEDTSDTKQFYDRISKLYNDQK